MVDCCYNSRVVKDHSLGLGSQGNHQLKASVFVDLEVRLCNQLSYLLHLYNKGSLTWHINLSWLSLSCVFNNIYLFFTCKHYDWEPPSALFKIIFVIRVLSPETKNRVFVSLERAFFYLPRERFLFHIVRHAAPPCFYSNPQQTNQTLASERVLCVFSCHCRAGCGEEVFYALQPASSRMYIAKL